MVALAGIAKERESSSPPSDPHGLGASHAATSAPATEGGSGGFLGWTKQGRGKWQVLCCGDTKDQCWDRLLEFGGGKNIARVVLPKGKTP